MQTAELNRINQYTPYGNLTYSITGSYPDGTPMYSQTQTLAPAQQQLLNLSNQGQLQLGNTAVGMLGQVKGSYANPINLSGLPGIKSSAGVSSLGNSALPKLQTSVGGQANTMQAIQDAMNAAYYGQTQYLDPQFAQGQEQLDNSLINQGVTQGSEAYNNAQNNFARQKQAAYGNAALQAVGAGQGEQNTLYGQALQSANFANDASNQMFTNQLGLNQQNFSQGLANANLQNQANAQALQQAFAVRNQPLNEYNALATGSQVTQPTFNSYSTSQVQPTNVAGITNDAYQNQLAAYQNQMAGVNNLFGLGGSIGSALIMSSDRRLKRDIKLVGALPSGIPVYDFRYITDGEEGPVYRGVMADEVAPVFPDAVQYDEAGFARVNYSRLK